MLLKLCDEWKASQKNLTRRAGNQNEKRKLLVKMMDNIFNIAHSGAVEQINSY